MKVKDVMTSNVRTCRIDSNLSDAAKSMWMRDCGVLPIVSDADEVVGILTDRDICIAAGSKNREPASIHVTDVMVRIIHSCSPETNIREALAIMRQKRVRRLVVLDANGKLCGILSLDDVAIRALAANKPSELSADDVEKTLAAISQRTTPQQEAA